MSKGRRNQQTKRGTARAKSNRGCSNKRKFTTAEAAEADMQAIIAKRVYINGASVSGVPAVYRCQRCLYWHWGHSPLNADAPAVLVGEEASD